MKVEKILPKYTSPADSFPCPGSSGNAICQAVVKFNRSLLLMHTCISTNNYCSVITGVVNKFYGSNGPSKLQP